MKRIVLPLLAAIALPTSLSAEVFNEKWNWWDDKWNSYNDYGYVEATKKSIIAERQGKRETALVLINILIILGWNVWEVN